ncbi:MAG: methyltransferase domain-containing protein [Clostridia bacterium]|nr:methyltransferase domain-containing protein [Clostridia bacterium]
MSNIEHKGVRSILDVGCGPGNSTEQLAHKWSDAKIVGIDKSPNMLEQAKQRLPDCQFELADANKDLKRLGKFDIVFSNAAIQWMPNHDQLIPRLYSMLNEQGALAVQIPDTRYMGITVAIEQAAMDIRWADKLAHLSPFCMQDMGYYYDICSTLSSDCLLWETKYYHVMDSREHIIEWYRSAGMRPYHDALGNRQDIADFENLVLHRMKKHYEVQQDGKVLFPFTRLFFVFYKNKR